jgi:hypothetical protein
MRYEMFDLQPGMQNEAASVLNLTLLTGRP